MLHQEELSSKKHCEFQALQFNYQDNINILTTRFQLPLLTRIIKVVNNITKSVLINNNTIDNKIPNKIESITILSLFQSELKEKQWSRDDVIGVAREVIQGIQPKLKAQKNDTSLVNNQSRFHFLPNHYQQSIALESVLHDIWKAHRKMMFWSKQLQNSDLISIEEVEDPISQNEMGEQLFELSELCLERLRIAFMQRTGLFANYEGQSLLEADQNRKEQLQIVNECIHQAIGSMLIMDNCQAAELRFLSVNNHSNSNQNNVMSDPSLLKQNNELQQQILQSITKSQQTQQTLFLNLLDQQNQQLVLQQKQNDLLNELLTRPNTNPLVIEALGKINTLIQELTPNVNDSIHQGIQILSTDIRNLQLLNTHTHSQLNRGLSELEEIKWNTSKNEKGELKNPLTYSTELSNIVKSTANSMVEMKSSDTVIPTIYNFT